MNWIIFEILGVVAVCNAVFVLWLVWRKRVAKKISRQEFNDRMRKMKDD